MKKTTKEPKKQKPVVRRSQAEIDDIAAGDKRHRESFDADYLRVKAENDAAAADKFMMEQEASDVLEPITPEEAANCHLSEDGQLLIADSVPTTAPLKPIVPPIPADVEIAFKNATEPAIVAVPELAPQPKLSTPHCRMCKYFVSNDERGALWASQGLCTAFEHHAKVVPEYYCTRFLFNEALRDGQNP